MSKAKNRRIRADYPFFSVNPDSTRLFAVCKGVPALDALEQASCFMAAARDAAYGSADNADSSKADGMYAAAYLIDMAKAVVDAAVNSLSKEEPRHE